MTKKQKLLSLIPALWTSLFDIVITIIYQPLEYWSGDLGVANEGNPIGSLFMKTHVSGLFVISFLWIVLICLLGYYLPKKLSRIFLLFIVIAHSFGASTWLSGRLGFWYVMAFILFNSILFYSIEDYARKNSKHAKKLSS
jgi:hypothetical protein